MASLISFPETINDKAARFVAGVVVCLSLVTVVTGAYWLTVLLAYGFWARVLTGPKLSPLGRLASDFVAPRYLGQAKTVPGPPKRFAQGVGVVFSTSALVLGLILGLHTAADVVLLVLAFAAGLESIFGLCLGCKAFALMMRLGWIPESTCVECADISARLRSGVSAGS